MALDTTVEQVDGDPPMTVLALDGRARRVELRGPRRDRSRALYDGGDPAPARWTSTDLRFMASSGLVALHSIVRIMHGEAPDDLEAGWGALHDGRPRRGRRRRPDRGPAVRPRSRAVQRVLDRTGLARLFVIHPDRATALAAF